MRDYFTVDCETDPFKEGRTDIKPFIWGMYGHGFYREFQTTNEFIDYVRTQKIVVYAHNGGKFDWYFVFGYLEGFSELSVINGRVSRFKIGECEFRDSWNILPMPLSAYKKDEFDYSILEKGERDKPHNRRAIQKYLYDDCLYLFELVDAFITQYGQGLTLAGTAMKYWQKHFDQKAPRTSRNFYEYFSPFYYGGRTECFVSGIIEKDFKVIDINSAYPDAMKNLHPYGKIYSVSETLPKSRAYIERAFITVECISRGALPFRDHQEKGALKFPNDNERRRFYVTGWEYLGGVETGTIRDIDIIEVITFSESIEFNDYVDHFYALKQESEKGSTGYIFAKLFLNSLYGKFAANPDEYKEYEIIDPAYVEASRTCSYCGAPSRDLCGCEVNDGWDFNSLLGPWALMSQPLAPEKQQYYNVATAASITGYVRAKLWRAICGVEGPMYCDTDSVACLSTGTLEMDPKKLGWWDIEAECDYGAIAGKKLYAFRYKNKIGTDFEWKTASKGVKLNAQEIIKVAKGETIEYAPIAPTFSLKLGIKIIPRKITKNAKIALQD